MAGSFYLKNDKIRRCDRTQATCTHSRHGDHFLYLSDANSYRERVEKFYENKVFTGGLRSFEQKTRILKSTYNLHESYIKLFLEDYDPRVRAILADTIESTDELDILSNDESLSVRQAVSKNSYLSIKSSLKLINDADPKVLNILASYSKHPLIIKKLLASNDEEILANLVYNSYAAKHHKELHSLNKKSVNLALSIFTKEINILKSLSKDRFCKNIALMKLQDYPSNYENLNLFNRSVLLEAYSLMSDSFLMKMFLKYIDSSELKKIIVPLSYNINLFEELASSSNYEDRLLAAQSSFSDSYLESLALDRDMDVRSTYILKTNNKAILEEASNDSNDMVRIDVLKNSNSKFLYKKLASDEESYVRAFVASKASDYELLDELSHDPDKYVAEAARYSISAMLRLGVN